jgi:hypothetical protein
MKSLDLFFPYVLPHVHGASDPAVIQALRQACIDFCKETDLVQRVAGVDVTAAAQSYAVPIPADMVFNRLLAVAWQGRWLSAVTPSDVESDVVLMGVAIGAVTPETGSPIAYFQKTPTDPGFSIYPIPDTTLALGFTTKVSFYPTQTTTTVDDVLFDEYADTIGAGAALRLMGTPGQTYTSPNTAFLRATYTKGLSMAAHQAVYGKLPVERRVRPVAFM